MSENGNRGRWKGGRGRGKELMNEIRGARQVLRDAISCFCRPKRKKKKRTTKRIKFEERLKTADWTLVSANL